MCPNQERPSEYSSSRRGFLFKLGLALNALGAILVGIPVVGYILAPARRFSSQSWIKLGGVDSFPVGQTRFAQYENPFRVQWDGDSAKVACWVRRVDAQRFQVFAVNCAHLGCPVRWFPQSKLFMCPCHGGVYYEDGSRASGPPPRGLFEYQYEIREGQLWVRGGQLPTLAGQV
jgi:menaquinol-cytochrome c reductase iron-sulfur subunit